MKLFEIDRNETFVQGCVAGRLLGKRMGPLTFTEYYTEEIVGVAAMYYGCIRAYETDVQFSLTINEIDVPANGYKWKLATSRNNIYTFLQYPNCDCNMYDELANLVEQAINDLLETGIEPQHTTYVKS